MYLTPTLIMGCAPGHYYGQRTPIQGHKSNFPILFLLLGLQVMAVYTQNVVAVGIFAVRNIF